MNMKKLKIEIEFLGKDKIRVKSDMPVLITKNEMREIKKAIKLLLS